MIIPRISIVTPSFNQGQFIERTLRSVLDQGYPELEYVVIDGGSSDNSVAIIQRYSKRLTYWVSETDRGQSHAINKGFERCSGEIYTWLNSDDYLLPGALDAVARAHAADPDAGAWVGECLRTTEGSDRDRYVLRGEVLDLQTLGEHWFDHFFGQPACFFSAEAWRQCGPLVETLHYSMDLDLWLKMLKRFHFAHVPALLACAPRHAEAKTVACRAASVAQTWTVRIQHGFADGVEREMAIMVGDHDQYLERISRFRRNPIYRIWKAVRRFLSAARNRVAATRQHRDYRRG